MSRKNEWPWGLGITRIGGVNKAYRKNSIKSMSYIANRGEVSVYGEPEEVSEAKSHTESSFFMKPCFGKGKRGQWCMAPY